MVCGGGFEGKRGEGVAGRQTERGRGGRERGWWLMACCCPSRMLVVTRRKKRGKGTGEKKGDGLSCCPFGVVVYCFRWRIRRLMALLLHPRQWWRELGGELIPWLFTGGEERREDEGRRGRERG